MTTDLDGIQQHINAGDIQAARRALISLLRTDPQNVGAWELLATISSDPAQQADCFRQILRIDPANRSAAIRLQALTGGPAEPRPQDKPSTPEGAAAEKEAAMRCPQCGGALEVRYIGEMRDKRAICRYCHTEVDLPDSYQRVKKKRTHEQHPGGSHTVEETIIETRHDGEQSPEDLTLTRTSATIRTKTEERDQGFFGRLFSRKGDKEEKFTPLSPTEIIELAGGALPPEERRQCPNPQCDATIPKDAARCTWCGKSL